MGGTVLLAPRPALAEEPIDPAVTGGETRIESVALADLPLEQVSGIGDVRAIDQVGTMLGVTWSGAVPDAIAVRGRGEDGMWGEWVELTPATDPMTAQALDGTQPAWLGPVVGMQVSALRAGSDVSTDLVAHVVTTSQATTDRTIASKNASPAPVGGSGAGTAWIPALGPLPVGVSSVVPGPNAPTFITRAGWGADESLTSGVSSSSSFRSVVLHHAEGSNSYTAAQSAQLIRGILAYHTKTQKWADVGYNAFVDKYGQIFEGRKGGLTKNISGAHARGYNSTTFGICMLGSYTGTDPSDAALTAVAQIAAWRLLSSFTPDVRSTSTFTSTESGTRFPVGSVNALPRLMAHRDVNLTDCCGDRLYGKLNTIRDRAQRMIDSGWRAHLDAFRAGGGADALGSVKEVAHPVGSYTVTILTQGIILSDGLSNSVAYASPFADDWKPEWGRPFRSASSSGGVTTQVFENGTARRPDGGSTTFTAGSPIPDGPVADGVYSVAYAPTLYKVSGGVATKLSGSDWAALGYPAPTPAPTDYVRYRWSGTIVAVTKWGKAESTWGVQHLDAASWSRAGSPTPRVVAYVPGSTFYRWSTALGDIFVEDQGGVKHKLSYSEWAAAGRPGSSLRSDQGYQKLSWDPAIAFMTSVSKGQGGPINGSAWAAAGYPAPQAVQRFPGDQIYWGTGGDIWYAGPTVNRKLSYAEWKALGSPWPAAAKR